MTTKSRNRYFQPNPNKNDKIGDCVVRSMCKAVDRDWDTVYKVLCNIGYRLKDMPNGNDTWREFLKINGFTEHKITVKKGSKRGTVAEFAEKNKKGTYVLQVANHNVTVVDGFYYDTWDCGDKSLYSYWEKTGVKNN
jgi:hypothetical protein